MIGKIDLKERHKIEKDFHDQWAFLIDLDEVKFKEAFNSITAIENQFALSQIKPLKGKKILDLGCGMGDASLYFASKGAKVYAVDISSGMINLVKRASKKYGLNDKITARVMSAERLILPKDYFDVIFGNGLLHHTFIDSVLDQVYKVLKPKGVAVFIEPLAHNPLINIYRKIAHKVRTPTETPLNYFEVNKLKRLKFRKFFHKEFHFFTLLIFIWYFLIKRINPNKERYWKKIINEPSGIDKIFCMLKLIDDKVFNFCPFLRKYYWNTVLVFIK